MRKILYFALSIIFLAAGSAAFGADFWEKKPYDKWSQSECNKLLQKSPWAQDFTQTDSSLQQSTKVSDDGNQLYFKYQFQFRSAPPIRQALVRQMQIAQKYDSLKPEQQQQFDQSAKTFLASIPDAVILYVTYEINSQTKAMELASYWRSRTMDMLKNTVFLRNSRGEQVALAQFIPPQGAERSFQFIFPRQINGKPFISPEDKSLMLEFTYPVVDIPGSFGGKLGDGKGFMEFKPPKMVFQGNLVY